ncbi:MAG: GspH/FimT family pseudopilin [Desulfobacterales bacterium]|nr:MAG: GspH/FimT family pseudopilin [Desulfobacterales bacterium]
MMRKNSGFTLWEVMTVLGIMAVLSTIAIPHFLGWLPKYRLGSAARDILSAMQYARLRAVKDNVDVRVNFDKDNNKFLIFPDYDSDDNQDADEPTIRRGIMPAGVTLENASFSIPDTFKFDSRGLASGNGGTISIANSRNELTRIRINRTGNSRILREDE